MKLLVLSLNFSPEPTGVGKVSGEMVQHLVERGHQVTVVCAPPHYPSWQLGAGNRYRYRWDQPQPGLCVLRCPLWVPRQPDALRRIAHQASFVATCLLPLLWLALRQRPAVVLVVSPATLCAPAAWLAARLCGAKAWLHLQDLELDAAFGVGLLRGRWLQAVCRRAERRLLSGFDRVSTISATMLRLVQAKGVAAPRTSLFPTWVDLQQIRPRYAADATQALRLALRIDSGQQVLMYAGSINRKQDLGTVIEAARVLQARSDLLFVVCGEGELRAVLQQQAQGLANVRWLPLQAPARLGLLLALADIHLLPQLRGAADLVLPSKLGGMLASGRPVIAAAEAGSEIAALLQHCGLCVRPQSVPAFVGAITALCDDRAQRIAMGLAARRVADAQWGRERVLDHFESELRGLVAGPPSEPVAAITDDAARCLPVVSGEVAAPTSSVR